MKENVVLVTFVVVMVLYSLAWFAVYRSLTTNRDVHIPVDSDPIELKRAEQLVRDGSTSVTLIKRQFGITRPGFFGLVILGYGALAVAFTFAYFVLFRSLKT